jgi:hypothetical protein
MHVIYRGGYMQVYAEEDACMSDDMRRGGVD